MNEKTETEKNIQPLATEKKEIVIPETSLGKNTGNIFLTKTDLKNMIGPTMTASKHGKNMSVDLNSDYKNNNLSIHTMYQNSTRANYASNLKNVKTLNGSGSFHQKYENKTANEEYNEFQSATPVNIKFPILGRKPYPVKINNLKIGLNKELARISHSYGKVNALKRFKENPLTQYYFDTGNYLGYRTSKMKDNNDIFQRHKLKPLMIEKDPGIERMSDKVFHMRNRFTEAFVKSEK
jgi:hypothetical protein